MRLIPPAHVKPYVRRNKSDQVDAAAIYEAMSRPGQRFVPVRSIDNQAELMRHRARELLAGQRTAALNALRGHLAEIGLIAAQGAQHAYGLKRMAADGFNENGEIVVPDCVRGALRSLVGQIDALDEAIGAIDRELAASVKADETAKRLMTIPGVGPVIASAIIATIPSKAWRSTRAHIVAGCGLVADGCVGTVGPKTSRKRQFSPLAAGLRLKVREGHSDESNALRRREHGTDQVEGDFMQPMPCLDRRFHRSAPS